MRKKFGVVLGALLAFGALAAAAGGTTITPANTASTVSGTAAFVSDNGMGFTVACSAVADTVTTPDDSGATPANNAGDTTTPGAVGFTIPKLEFTNCLAGGVLPFTFATLDANGGWYFSGEFYPSTSDSIGVIAFQQHAADISFTVPGVGTCVLNTNPSTVSEVQGEYDNSTSTLTISDNQLDFGIGSGAAACGAIGISATLPMQFSASLTFSNGFTIGM